MWVALGSPALGRLVPSARCPAWQFCRACLRAVGVRREFCSPAALWTAVGRPPLRSGSVAPGTTLATLYDQVPLSLIADTSLDADHGPWPRLCSWNVRWLVAPHSDINVAKKIFILTMLAEGKVVVLQENHWNDNDGKASSRAVGWLPPLPGVAPTADRRAGWPCWCLRGSAYSVGAPSCRAALLRHGCRAVLLTAYPSACRASFSRRTAGGARSTAI